MADSGSSKHLQPSLLDRLIDDQRDQEEESRERRVLSLSQLRRCVLRDLGWLLNCGNLRSVTELDGILDEEEAKYVESSVLNYGVAELAGATISGTDSAALERAIRQAIWDFEPRILRNTLKVRVVADDASTNNAISFEIQGELWAKPSPLHLALRTAVDLESGDFTISDDSGIGW